MASATMQSTTIAEQAAAMRAAQTQAATERQRRLDWWARFDRLVGAAKAEGTFEERR